MADRFFIAPYDQESGLQTDVRPWLVPDTAFAQLTNAYVFRGRVRKRFGSRWLGDTSLVSRLRVLIATTDGAGNTPAGTFVPRIGGVPIATPAIGQMFSVGTQIFTCNALGLPANLLSTGAATGTYNTTTGAVVINGADINTPVYFYPSLPVMGLLSYDSANVNDEPTYAFDTRFAYYYAAGWERLAGEAVAGAARWTGTDTQFFWGCTWTGVTGADRIFFVTNFNVADGIRYYNATTAQWNNFRPQISATEFLNSARIIVPFKNRLVALNTWEGAASPGLNYQNRCRYSQVGSPLDVSGWRQDIPGRGNAIDAPTTEAITTVEFIKDRLIVYFERSTWELVYAGNQAYPFVWQQINNELGAESTFSEVPFDKVVLGVGNVGIHACNGANVERIDTKVPDVVFEIHNDNGGVDRVYGIRDYYVETVYWTFPDTQASTTSPYPRRVLVYNYKTGTWALNEDSITCFGYFQPTTGIVWSSTTVKWIDTITWASPSLQAKFRQVTAGNQEGFTFICDADVPTNTAALQITDLTVAADIVTITSINHNLQSGDYVSISGIVGTGTLTTLNGLIFSVSPINADSLSFTVDPTLGIAGVYAGGGLMARVSRINILTKEYNFYAKQGRNAAVSKVDFMVDTTAAGQLMVECYASTNQTVPLITFGSVSGALLGTSVLETSPYPSVPFEVGATRVWHPVYFQAEGEVVQFQLTMTDAQMRDPNISNSDFQLHALCITATPTSQRLQ